MLKSILISLFLLIGISTYSQNYSDVIWINQAVSPFLNNEDSSNARILETNFTLRAPLYLQDSTTFFLLNVSLNRTKYSFLQSDENRIFGGGFVGLIHFRQWNENWSSQSTLQIGSFSELNNFTWNGPQYFLGSIWTRKINEELSLGLGFLVGKRIRFNYYIPLGQIIWKPYRKWTFSGLAPGNAVINYQATPERGFGFNYIALGNAFNIRDFGVDFLSETPVNFPWTYLRFNLYYDQFFFKDLAFRIEAGWDFVRNLQAFDPVNVVIPETIFLTGKYPPKPFIRAGVYFRVRN
ncbi:MAG: DUF6268 family outer membrane beta-barrel protein [Bacteroidota bacterium]